MAGFCGMDSLTSKLLDSKGVLFFIAEIAVNNTRKQAVSGKFWVGVAVELACRVAVRW